jgi:PmbA protein
MARVAPEDPYAGLADPDKLAREVPELDLLDPDLPTVAVLEERAKRAESAGLAVKGVTKSGGASASAGIGGMVLVTSGGFRGAYLSSGQSVSMTAIAGEGTAMERDYDYSLHAARRRSRVPGEGRPLRRRAHGRAAQSAQQSIPSACPSFDRRCRLARESSRQRDQRPRSRARPALLKDKLGQRLFKPGINIVDDPRRRRGLRSRPFDAEGVATKPLAVVEDGALMSWFLDSATARELGLTTTGHAQRGVSSAPSPGPSNLHLSPGPDTPEALVADIAQGFYVTDLIGMGVNQVTGDYSRGASGFWIENGKRSYPVSEVTIAGTLIDMFQAVAGQ